MLVDIFSGFDPGASGFCFSLSFSWGVWVISFLGVLLMMSSYWVKVTRMTMVLCMMLSFSVHLIDDSRLRMISGGVSLLGPFFPFLALVNLYGLVPYVLPISSHFFFCSSFSLPFWGGLVLCAMTWKPKSWVGSLIPGSVPNVLVPFLFMIEVLSSGVRSMTLAIRLMANMTLGHMIIWVIGLGGSVVIFTSLFGLIMLIMVMMLYMCLEVGVCILQSYIFCLLLTLYSNEHPF